MSVILDFYLWVDLIRKSKTPPYNINRKGSLITTMENKQIQLTITEKDVDLYDFLKNHKSEESMKIALSEAANLYTFCNGTDVTRVGYLCPEAYRDTELSKYNKEQLLNLKKIYQEKVLEYAAGFDPNECDCGILISPEGERWFIDEQGWLGYMVLYSRYIKMIDELLGKLTD